MKKILFFAAAAVAMLTGCSQNDDLTAPTVAQDQQQTAIEFGSYLGKVAQTRTTAYVGNITDTELQSSTKANGFGVIAFYTGADDYPNSGSSAPASYSASTLKANFMFNQHVTYSTDHWTYSPLKYWPNEVASGAVDGQDPAAQGTTAHGKISFFAYAPWMDEVGTTGITKVNGKTTLTGSGNANDQTGNPTITYKMSANGQDVDLLWGTCPDAESYNIVPNSTQGGNYVWKGTTNPGDKGKAKVNVNLTKQKTAASEANAEKINFLFKHSLAKIGGGKKGDATASGLTIKLDPDFGNSFGDQANAQTAVTVKKITIKNNRTETTLGTRDVKRKNEGTLDLATGFWTLEDTNQDFEQSINNATDFTTGDVKLNANIQEQVFNDAASAEYWGTSDGNMLNGTHKGVTTTEQQVYDEDVAPLLYFPGETPSLEVEIEYIVRTKDKSLIAGYSEATQKIKRIVTFGSAVEMNKKYNLVIILGLTSVKFEATVDNWADADTNGDSNVNDDDDIKVNLPLNVVTPVTP